MWTFGAALRLPLMQKGAWETATEYTVAALEAAALGSLSGSIILLFFNGIYELPRMSVDDLSVMALLFLFPAAVLLLSAIAIFIVLPCVIVFGIASGYFVGMLPISRTLAAAAALVGCLIGWGVWASIEDGMPLVGVCYGATTGLFWYLRCPRRALPN